MRAIAALFPEAGFVVEPGALEVCPARCDDADGVGEAERHHHAAPPASNSTAMASRAIRCGGIVIGAILAGNGSRLPSPGLFAFLFWRRAAGQDQAAGALIRGQPISGR